MSSRKKKIRKQPTDKATAEIPWFKFYPEGVRKHIDYPDRSIMI